MTITMIGRSCLSGKRTEEPITADGQASRGWDLLTGQMPGALDLPPTRRLVRKLTRLDLEERRAFGLFAAASTHLGG